MHVHEQTAWARSNKSQSRGAMDNYLLVYVLKADDFLGIM